MVLLCTPSEYEEGKRIHIAELKIYRKRWHYLVGLLLTIAPMIDLFRKYEVWDVWLSVLLLAIGNMLIRDTISEHYVVKLMRESKRQE
jgi:hypothetical protein